MKEVVCGIMKNRDGKFLLGLRRQPKVWEFPGGKLEENESLDECLKREWKEELNLDIEIESLVCSKIYLGNMCHFYVGIIKDLNKIELREHTDIGFFDRNTIKSIMMFSGDKEIIYQNRI
jgi:8-oxo-dGTP diphosphatase